jgi:hypothetical protein
MRERQDFLEIFYLMNHNTAPMHVIECVYFAPWHIYVLPPINSPNYFTQDDKIEAVFFTVINLEYKEHKMLV